jgi:hypothetical protein
MAIVTIRNSLNSHSTQIPNCWSDVYQFVQL